MIKAWGSTYATFPTYLRANQFVDTVIQYHPDGTLDVIYDGNYVVADYYLGYTPPAGSYFGFYARTGGSTDNHFIDNLSITTQTNAIPFADSFSPIGRTVATNAAINIVLTDYNTEVNTNALVLSLDGVTVTPTSVVQTNNAASTLNTVISYVPPSAFAFSSTHSVSLSFADNATPVPDTNTLQYGFTVIANYTVLWADGFEGYKLGDLDANVASDVNTAPDGGQNPWWGAYPPNDIVTGSYDSGVTPHSGTNMITSPSAQFYSIEYLNLGYRFNHGNYFAGNVALDWWFYDPSGQGDSTMVDTVAFEGVTTTGGFSTNDYPSQIASSSYDISTYYNRLQLGMSTVSTGTGSYDPTKYQVRVSGAQDSIASGWFNSLAVRSVGWHHARILIEPALADGTANINFYIDNMAAPVFVNNSYTAAKYNFLEVDTACGSGSTYSAYDDFALSEAFPLTLSYTVSGANLVLAWTGPFVLQSASSVTGPYTDVASGLSPYTATSPYAYNMTTNPAAFFRLRN